MIREIAWARVSVSPRAILGRHSRRHLLDEGSGRTLCGRIPRWAYVHASHEGDCSRCFAHVRADERMEDA